MLLLASLTSVSALSVTDKNLQTTTGDTIYVDDDGGKDYTKIQDAIDNATNEDTIIVYNGTYYENVLVNKSINLLGENNQTTIIDGQGCTLKIVADSVNISSFTITNSSSEKWNISGLCVISNYVTIENCVITDNARSVLIYYSNNITFQNNIIKNDMYNPRIEHSVDCRIIKNYFQKTGLQIRYSNNNLITENSFYDYSSGLYLENSSSNTVSYNKILDSEDDGIYIGDHSIKNDIHHNHLENIKLFGLILDIHSNQNKIYHNNFINCMVKAYSWKSPFNIWYRNYWNRPRILPKIIFGRVGSFSFSLRFVNIDPFPALRPYKI